MNHSKSRSQDINHRVNRLIKAFESVGRLHRYELAGSEIDQIAQAAKSALSRTQLALQSPAIKKKNVFLLMEESNVRGEDNG